MPVLTERGLYDPAAQTDQRYEWEGGTLYRNISLPRADGYSRARRTAVAHQRGGGEIDWIVRPTRSMLAQVGADPMQPFEFQGQHMQYRGGSPVPTVVAGEHGRTMPEQLMHEYQTAYDEARQANIERYEEGLALLDQVGAERRGEIERRFTGLQTQAQQDLVGRGLRGTTVAPTMQAGIERHQQDALTMLGSQLAQQRLAWVGDRMDLYPELHPYLNLMQMYGEYGAGPSPVRTGGVTPYRPPAPPAGLGGVGTRHVPPQPPRHDPWNPFGPAPTF